MVIPGAAGKPVRAYFFYSGDRFMMANNQNNSPSQKADETPAFCNYDQSDYQHVFWEEGHRQYEDESEAIALKRLLPEQGNLLLEIGAGAGRNTLRYKGYEKIVLMDYALTQMQQAKAHLGNSPRFTYVAADVYHLPFKSNAFDGATMIRVIHHLTDLDPAMAEIQRVMQQNSVFILEYANKRNIKAIFRWIAGKQSWNPFTHEQVEFVKLNFDNHPAAIRKLLVNHGFRTQRVLSVSNLRVQSLKENESNLGWMLKVESVLQILLSPIPLSPSVFTKNIQTENSGAFSGGSIFSCPACGCENLTESPVSMTCPQCGKIFPIEDGIYNFRLD